MHCLDERQAVRNRKLQWFILHFNMMSNFSICQNVLKGTQGSQLKIKSPFINSDSSQYIILPAAYDLRCFCSRQLFKKLCQKKKLIMMSNFSICQNVFNPIEQLYFKKERFFILMSMYFQSHLLQICCIWGKGCCRFVVFGEKGCCRFVRRG